MPFLLDFYGKGLLAHLENINGLTLITLVLHIMVFIINL